MRRIHVKAEANGIAVIAAALIASAIAAYFIRLAPVLRVYTPDGPFWAFMEDPRAAWWLLVPLLAPPTLVLAFGLLRAIRGRSVSSLTLSGGFGFVVASTVMSHSMLATHLDPELWVNPSRPVGWRLDLLVTLILGALAGLIVWRVVRRWGLDALTWGPTDQSALTAGIESSQVAVWFGRVKAPRLLRAFIFAGLIAVWLFIGSTAILKLALGTIPAPEEILGVLLTWVVVAAGVAFMALIRLYARVRINARSVSVSFGPWGWPVRKFGLDDVSHAKARDVRPIHDFGGYGYRWRPAATGIVIRGGEALWLRKGERWFVITVDGAEEAAGVVNDLIQGRGTEMSTPEAVQPS